MRGARLLGHRSAFVASGSSSCILQRRVTPSGSCLSRLASHASIGVAPYMDLGRSGLPHIIRESRIACREPPGTARRGRYRGGLRVRETSSWPPELVYVRERGRASKIGPADSTDRCTVRRELLGRRHRTPTCFVPGAPRQALVCM